MSAEDVVILNIHNITEDESFDTQPLPTSTTVVEVKNHILEVKGYDLNRQNLVFNGQKLPDEQTLEEVGIDSENNSLCLVVSLRKVNQKSPVSIEEELQATTESSSFDNTSELERKEVRDIKSLMDNTIGKDEMDEDAEANPLEFFATSLFQGFGSVAESLKDVKNTAVQDFTDLTVGLKTLIGTEGTVESEEDRSVENLHKVLDGTLDECVSLFRAASEYRQFLIEMEHVEAEFISRIRSCQSHVIMKAAANTLAEELEPRIQLIENKRNLLTNLVIDPVQTIIETQLEPADQIRDIYRDKKKIHDQKNSDYRNLQTEIAEIKEQRNQSATSPPSEQKNDPNLMSFFGGFANFVQTAGQEEYDLNELEEMGKTLHQEVLDSGSDYELCMKDFLKAMANIDVKMSGHIKSSFEGFAKGINEIDREHLRDLDGQVEKPNSLCHSSGSDKDLLIINPVGLTSKTSLP